MRLHHWLISLKHRRRVAASSGRRKSYRSLVVANVAPSSEALETRLLLTTPPPVDPVEEAQNDADAAQQALDDANSTRDTEMAGIQSQFDTDSAGDTNTFNTTMQGIDATLDSDVAAGDAALESDKQAAQGAFDTALDGVGDTVDADLDTADADFEADMQSAENDFNSDVATATASFETDMATEEANLDSAIAGYQATYDADAAIASADFDSDLAAEDTAFETASAAAWATFDTNEALFFASYETSITTNDALYETNMATHQATLDSALNLYPNVTFDPDALINDPSVQGTIASEDTNLQSALDGYGATFDSNMQGHLDTYNSNVDGHHQDHSNDMDTAQSTYDASIVQADTYYNDDVNTATDIYNTALDGHWDDYQDDLDAAQGVYTTSISAANDIYNSSMQTAKDNFDTAEATAMSTFTTNTTNLSNTNQQNLQTIQDTYDSDLQSSSDQFSSDMQPHLVTYTNSMQFAEDQYNSAVAGFEITRSNSVNPAQDQYDQAESAAADTYYDAEMSYFMSCMMGACDDTVMDQAAKDYQVTVSAAAIPLAVAVGSANVQFVTSERGADTTRQQTKNNAEYTLAVAQLDAAKDKAHRDADYRKTYLKGRASENYSYEKLVGKEQEIYDQAVADATQTMDKAVNAAKKIQSKAYADAQKVKDDAVAAAGVDFVGDEAGIASARDKAIADAGETYANDVAAADAQFAKDQAAADANLAKYLTAEEVAYAGQALSEYATYVSNSAGAFATWTANVAGAMASAFNATNPMDPDTLAVSAAWNSFYTDTANEGVSNTTSNTSAATGYLNQAVGESETATDLEVDAAKTRAYNLTDDYVDLVGDVASTANIFAHDVLGDIETYTNNTAGFVQTLTQNVTAADKTRTKAVADASENVANAAVDAIHGFMSGYLPELLTLFEDTTDANETAQLKGIDDSISAAHQAIDATHALQVAKAGYARSAANNAATKDDPVAIAEAEKAKTQGILSAQQEHADIQNRAVWEFSGQGPYGWTSFVGEAFGFITGTNDGLFDAMSEFGNWAYNDGLDMATDFTTGWADSLTGGAHARVRQFLGIDDYVNYDSYAYMGGQITGSVHGIFLGGGAGAVAHSGRAYAIARGFTTVETAWSMGEAGLNVYQGDAGLSDVLSFAPGAGYIAGRMTDGLGVFKCFVGDTQVVIRKAETPILAAADPLEETSTDGDSQLATIVFAAAMIPVGLGGFRILRRRRGTTRREKTGDANSLDTWSTDPHRLLEGNTSKNSLPKLKADELDQLCDRLFSEPVAEQHRDVSPPVERDWNHSAASLLDETSGAGRDEFPRPGYSVARPDNQGTTVATQESSIAVLERPSEQTASMQKEINPVSTRSTVRNSVSQRRGSSTLATVWLMGCLAVSGLFGWRFLSNENSTPPDRVVAAAPVSTTQQSTYVTKSIQDIRIGERVLAHNPEVTDLERRQAIEADSSWRHLQLEMKKADDSVLKIELLRPSEWVVSHNAYAGTTIHLDLEEMGASGPARVVNIGRAPPLAKGPGQIVTGTFSHSAGNVINLYVDGLDKPIGTTDNHPFWSEDRQAFIPAGDLQSGEHLRTEDGNILAVTASTPRVADAVFNLEVNVEHVYFVHSAGILVHNSYMTGDQIALKELVSEASLGGRRALDADDAATLLDWADEVSYPGWRAGASDINPIDNHWVGGPHIHFPGVGNGHIPVQPGVIPR